MGKSSVTDWIQAIAVVIALGLGYWEFVVQDRASESSKKDRVVSLITAGQDSTLHLASSHIVDKLEEYADGKLHLDYLLNSEPHLKHYNAWAFCYVNELCDKELTLEYVCRDFVSFNNIREELFEAAKKEQKDIPASYVALLAVCRARV